MALGKGFRDFSEQLLRFGATISMLSKYLGSIDTHLLTMTKKPFAFVPNLIKEGNVELF
jgi:hypothetical protein